jgi:hypothetical protein
MAEAAHQPKKYRRHGYRDDRFEASWLVPPPNVQWSMVDAVEFT